MKLIILDRDGVINVDSEEYVKSPEEWIPIPGSIEAISRLTRAGWTVCVATNQSGLARGLFDVDTLEAMHDKMRGLIAQSGGTLGLVAYCPHGPDDGCDCRKPLSGLFQQIADYYRVPLVDVPTVGDSRRDLEAGSALGCRPYLVLTGKGSKTASQALPERTQIFDDLAAVAEHLLDNQA